MYIRINQILLVAILICVIISTNSKSVTTQSYHVATTLTESPEYSQSRLERSLDDYEETSIEEGRGMIEDHMESDKAIKNDPWQGYYDFLINEGSFKFWAVFQVVTAVILIYSAFAAVYYAKYNFIQPDDDYTDYFLKRSNSGILNSNDQWFGLNSQTFQRILDAISSKKYS